MPIFIILALLSAAPRQTVPQSKVSDPAPATFSQPSPGAPARVEALPPLDPHLFAQNIADAIATPIVNQMAAQTNATNAALSQLADAVAKLSDAQTKSDERRSADMVTTRALLVSQPAAQPTATLATQATMQPGVRPVQSDCAAACPGPASCNCPCADALKASQSQLRALQARPKSATALNPLGRFAGQDDSGQWFYSNDSRSVQATVARENRRLRGETVEDQSSPVMVPVRQSTYTAQQASYADAPTSYAAPQTYSMPTTSYYQPSPTMDGGYGGASFGSSVTYGSSGGGSFGGQGLFSGIFGGGLLAGGGCAGGSCR